MVGATEPGSAWTASRHWAARLYRAALRLTRVTPDRADAGARLPEGCVVGPVIDVGIVAAMRALPYRHRLVVYLADVEGLRYGQISDLTGMPVGRVKSYLHRGRGRLREQLVAYAPPHPGKKTNT